MGLKLVFGVIAMLLVLGFLGVIAFKLKEVSLAVIVLIGAAMMAYDLWESLREKDS
jgi:hypothetical protein